ncbi:apolipoprotein N-acyltransferase [Jannaschia donghaensis]|uniref:Apolipoprotein N-acyltransferase n=1 Tax=Jannaschia donghaensis TaxID=420998 RepID=A0A0M6YLQ7_9RHOB|nr:apolipoprotein N-acyltransferase [Jannaschia donghaensis]CTQ49986.1 Apolipoprotein N-acyltransferase [Jannaschia donghaensis]
MRHLALFLPVVAGLAAALGQAPWELWFVALPAYAIGIAAMARARRPFVAGLLFGTAHFALALHWIVEPFLVDAAATGWMAPIALLAISLGFGLFWAVAASLGARARYRAFGIAVGIAAVELVRSYLLTGFPWALPGHILIASPALPAASLVGAHGLGLAVLLGGALLATRGAAARACGFALWGLPFGVGLAMPPAPPVAADAPVVRLVQPNAPQHQKWDPDFISVFFRRGLEATAAPALGAPPVAVIWPETALPELLRYSEEVRPRIAAAAGGRPVMIGAQRFDDDRRPRNSLVLLTGPEGEVAAVHDKYRLVPFGEYLPFESILNAMGIGAFAAQLAGGYAPGDGPILLDLPGVGRVLPLICYEAIFPQELRRLDRPRVIVHLTNDAWFGTDAGPQQHLALARLRAAESGLPFLRAANTGVSAAIDARGTILASLPLGQAGHLDVAVPPALPAPLYIVTGDWAALAVIFGLIAALGAQNRGFPVAPARNRP